MKIIFLLAALGFVRPAHADVEKWHLFGIEVTVGTKTISGYGIATSYWALDSHGDDGDMIRRFLAENTIRLVKDVEPVNYPLKCMVTTTGIIEIPRKTVSAIRRLPKPHDGYEWYGVMNVYKPSEVKLLQGPPVAQCTEKSVNPEEEGPGESVWLSYNKGFPIEKLNDLCEGRMNEPVARLRSKSILPFELSGD